MKTKLNIAEILKDKLVNTKLYSPVFGDVYLLNIDTKDIIVKCHGSVTTFYHNGKLYEYDEAEPLLFPSKEMRDWGKFSWKKGDVLVNKDGDVHIIFERFVDDTYCSFVGKYYLWKENNDTEHFYKNERLLTSDFQKAGKDAAQTYISTIEERLGGKLNRETLEIEKAQPEFKDGDIVCISGMGYLAYGIVKSIDYSSKKLEYYVLNDMSTLKFEDWLSFEDKQIQPITETQQIILFDALAKEGKAWDSEKKAIVNLKQEIELKPFDKVLVKDNPYGSWEPAIFWEKVDAIDLHPYMVIGGKRYRFCEPYEGNEHLLGTTKDVEG